MSKALDRIPISLRMSVEEVHWIFRRICTVLLKDAFLTPCARLTDSIINSFVSRLYRKSNVNDGMLTYTSHMSDHNPAITIKWDKAMQEIAEKYSSDAEYMFPILTKEGNADEADQIKRSRHNVVYNLRSIGKQYKFSVSPTIAMTKDLWRKIMDEVSVSEVI